MTGRSRAKAVFLPVGVSVRLGEVKGKADWDSQQGGRL